MEVHRPYQDRLLREPDFIVDYEIDLCEELKNSKPGQGMRLDFLYEGDDLRTDGIHMIWPEILDEKGNVIKDLTPSAIPAKGTANMWVFDDKQRPYHAERIRLGTRGYWVRGSYRLARVSVIKIGSLKC